MMFLPLLLTLLGGNELPPTPCVDVSYTIRADSAVVRGGKLAVAGRVTNHRKEVIAIVPSALPGSWSAMQSTRLRGFSAFDSGTPYVCGDNVGLEGVIPGRCYQ